jgi:hypothetical protein
MLFVALLAGLTAQPTSSPPPVPVITREEVERAPPPEQNPRRFSSRKKHALQFDDGPGCTVELALEKGQKVIVDDDGIEIRDDPPTPAETKTPDAQTGADAAPVNSCSPR